MKNKLTAGVNVNAGEVRKFAALATRWWDKTGPLQTLHEINPLRLAFINTYIDLKDKTVLDVGCGGGILTESLATAGARVSGIDLAAEAIAAAKHHAECRSKLTVNYQVADVAAVAAAAPGTFDVITCMELLEHVPHPEQTLNALDQLVKPHGLIFLSTINKNLKAYLAAIIAAEYVLRLLPKKTHQYGKFIPPATIARQGRALGWQLIGVKGFSYNPLTKKYFLTSNCEVNYLMAFKKQPEF